MQLRKGFLGAFGVSLTTAGMLLTTPPATASASQPTSATTPASATPNISRAAVAWPDLDVTWHLGGPNIIGRYSKSESREFSDLWLSNSAKMRADVRKAVCGAADRFQAACEVGFDNTVPDFTTVAKQIKANPNRCIAIKFEVTSAKSSSWTFNC